MFLSSGLVATLKCSCSGLTNYLDFIYVGEEVASEDGGGGERDGDHQTKTPRSRGDEEKSSGEA